MTLSNSLVTLSKVELSAMDIRYCDFSISPNDREHVLRFALGSGIIFIKFVVGKPLRC